MAIVYAVLTVSAGSCGSMEASSRAADAPRHRDDGELTGGRASAQLDAAHTALLPAPDSYTNGHSMREHTGSLDKHAHAVSSPDTESETAAGYQPVAAQALAPSAPGPLLAMLTPHEATAQEPPSLGVLSTQEHPARGSAPSDAAPRCVSDHIPTCDDGEHPSDVEVPTTDARTPVPPPALVAPEASPAGQHGASAGEPPVSMPSAVDARTPQAVPQCSAPASAEDAERVDVTGQLTPGTVSALADLLSGVSISAAATPPSASRKQDAAVGLVYDEAMERHWGPASACMRSQTAFCHSDRASLARQ